MESEAPCCGVGISGVYLLNILIFNIPQIYLFNHFHHMVRNTQQSEAPI